MPAVSLNTRPADNEYNLDAQADLMKLWLLLTTYQDLVNDSTQIFETTKLAEAFVNAPAQSSAPGSQNYIDLEALTGQMKVLKVEDVSEVFDMLNIPANRKVFQAVAQWFWDRGNSINPPGYGTGGCICAQDILNLS
jgi:hypothetical protein